LDHRDILNVAELQEVAKRAHKVCGIAETLRRQRLSPFIGIPFAVDVNVRAVDHRAVRIPVRPSPHTNGISQA
jgi:hypothetical protein